MPSPLRLYERMLFLARLVQARLRMVLAVAIVFALIAGW
ncbi:MAG: hypothetical protein RIS70_341, partial [Planctomycetota bacterium]